MNPPTSPHDPDPSSTPAAGPPLYPTNPDTPRRGFHDYVLIVRERAWLILAILFIAVAASIACTLLETKVYQSRSLIQILRRDPAVLKVQSVTDNDVRSLEDLNTIVQILESAHIAQKVSDRLTGEKLARFMAPYLTGAHNDPLTPTAILLRHRRIIPRRLSLIIEVQYRHPDRIIAAEVANLLVDEFIAYNSRTRIDETMKAVDELRARFNDQRTKVETIAARLQTYRETHNMVSLDQRRDILTENLKARHILVAENEARLNSAEIRWHQIEEFRAANRDLTELSFVASHPLIGELKQQHAAQKIAVAQLAERYRAKHPRMLDATRTLAQIATELSSATAEAAALVESDFRSAARNAGEARRALASEETHSLGVDRAGLEFESLDRELKIEEQLLQHLMGRMRETTLSSTLESQNARVVDPAFPSQPDNYIKPVPLLYLGLGLFGGLALALGSALFLACIDDRVKSAFDIERVLGLHLLGVIPSVRKMPPAEKAHVATTRSDPAASEAFLTLFSNFRLRDHARSARCILVTSTVPGEGKSFTATNLALTFAAHGERVVIVDCDLRRPILHTHFDLPNQRGLIDLCTGVLSIEAVAVSSSHPNLDVITAGGRVKNPSHVLNSPGFERTLTELRARYDRVVIDTPPIAAVSDALLILPFVDGSLFTIYFDRVRRRAAEYAARCLLDSDTPNYGAILNGLTPGISGYYYGQYQDKSYKTYHAALQTPPPGSNASP